jgi:hypothetical protein
MTVNEFKVTLKENSVPKEISNELKALWYDAKGDWNKAHQIVQSMHTKNAAWVHAYLHRKEPDEWNASYWYSIAGREKPKIPYDVEWEEITRNLLSQMD